MYSTQIAREPSACNTRFPLTTTSFREPVMSTVDDRDVARFWQKVNKTDSCWLWVDTPTPKGYATFSMCHEKKWRNHFAHRISWVIHNGPIPKGLFVCHKCDNRICVNPSHLFIGTNQDNVDDMVRKGRNHIPASMDSPTAKINDTIVMEIRNLAAAGVSVSHIAKNYPIKGDAIYDVIKGISWKHLPVLGVPIRQEPKKQCEWCGVEFERRKRARTGKRDEAFTEFSTRRFCSKKCSVALQYRHCRAS